MKIYIVNGAPGSGKTTFEKYVSYISAPYCYNLSTVDFVKEVATYCGWNGEKELKDRKFLSELKRVLTEWDDIPIKKIKKEIGSIKFTMSQYNLSSDKCCVFIDCREPKEIERLCNELGAKSLLIRRETAENKETSNESDANVLNYNYDIIIDNNGTIRDLAFRAIDFVDEEGLNIKKDQVLQVDFFGTMRYI